MIGVPDPVAIAHSASDAMGLWHSHLAIDLHTSGKHVAGSLLVVASQTRLVPDIDQRDQLVWISRSRRHKYQLCWAAAKVMMMGNTCLGLNTRSIATRIVAIKGVSSITFD